MSRVIVAALTALLVSSVSLAKEPAITVRALKMAGKCFIVISENDKSNIIRADQIVGYPGDIRTLGPKKNNLLLALNSNDIDTINLLIQQIGRKCE